MREDPESELEQQRRQQDIAEQRYRQLLRWYPRAWRAKHGEVMLGMMLDDARARERHAPTVLALI